MMIAILVVALFLTALLQGAIALMASAELAGARWHLPIRTLILRLAPLQWLGVILFVWAGWDLTLFPWSAADASGWLDPLFFRLRVVILLSITTVLSEMLSAGCRKGYKNKNGIAVGVILFASLTEIMAAWDWIMSFEYPWISTIFPLLWVLQALILGVAFAILVSILGQKAGSRETSWDLGSLLLGLSLFSAGMWFAQYLTIWFANLPEEVVVLQKRLEHTVCLWGLGVWFVCGVVGPLGLLTSRRLRAKPQVLVMAATLSFFGVLGLLAQFFGTLV